MHNLNCNYSQTRVNTDTQGAIESVLVNEVSVLSQPAGTRRFFRLLKQQPKKAWFSEVKCESF